MAEIGDIYYSQIGRVIGGQNRLEKNNREHEFEVIIFLIVFIPLLVVILLKIFTGGFNF
jgi:hypothetical protein